VRGNGSPLYTLVNPVDDALMRITHVLRGEDLLPSTPRQIALYHALIDIGVTDFVPAFGHLPYVMGEGNRKLSKRDPQASLNTYRDNGYLPEGLINYLALLGWSIADDHDVFSLPEMVAAFDVADVNSNPARFDPKKCLAINSTHMRMLAPEDFSQRLQEFLLGRGVITPADRPLVDQAAPLIQERIATLADAIDLLAFLFVSDEDFAIDEKAAAKNLGPDGLDVVQASLTALDPVSGWSAADIEQALRAELIESRGLKPRDAFGPLRVAITGQGISPPLFESMELLGRDKSLARLRAVIG